MTVLLSLVNLRVALIIHGLAAPAYFIAIAWNYFRAHSAREPLPAALAWTAIGLLLDLVVVAGAVQRSLALFESVIGTWLPVGLIFLASWSTGVLLSMMPDGARPAATIVSR
jgi:hypothetical protein